MWTKLLCLLVVANFAKCAEFENIFSWTKLRYEWSNETTEEEAIVLREYIPKNNLPLGIAKWRNKLFITVPRWKPGVPSSLNYILLDDDKGTIDPALIPYPNWRANELPLDKNEEIREDQIVSTCKVRVDSCDRLWVLDTGDINALKKRRVLAPPALVVFDLTTNELLRRYTFGDSDLEEESLFANLVVDDTQYDCHNAYAYVPDYRAFGLVVYSWATNESWRIKHNFFHFSPLDIHFKFDGLKFQWGDGIYGLTLGPFNDDGYRMLYFHPLSSTHEFSVSTEILQNKTTATDPGSFYLFKIEGNKGEFAQSATSDYDWATNVMFFTQINKYGIACWNLNKTLAPENVDLVVRDKEVLSFPNDLIIDDDRNLWVLTNKLPRFVYRSLNLKETNYRVFRIPVDEFIEGTKCYL